MTSHLHLILIFSQFLQRHDQFLIYRQKLTAKSLTNLQSDVSVRVGLRLIAGIDLRTDGGAKLHRVIFPVFVQRNFLRGWYSENLLRTLYKLRTSFLQTLKELLTNLVRTSNKLCTHLLRTSLRTSFAFFRNNVIDFLN
jgi:hypothetical protein